MLMFAVLVTALCFGPSVRAALPDVVRADITLEPSNRSLQTALAETLQQYRDSLNAVNLSPSPNRLAQGERQRMRRVLESRGFYGADIIHRVVDVQNVDLTWRESFFRIFKDTPTEGERVQYRIDTGERYEVLAVDVEGADVELPEDWPQAGVGSPLVAEDILADQSRLRAVVDEQSCFFRLEVTHEVRLDPQRNGGEVLYRVSGSDPSRIGSVQFEGDEGVSADYLRRQSGLRAGECFSRADIDQAVLNLYQTQLFATVRRDLNRDESGQVAVRFDVVQRAPRTLSTGIGWDTDQGFGLSLGWEHRNLWTRAQRVNLATRLQEERQEVSASLTLPGFLEPRNTLAWDNTVSHETPADEEYYIAESRATISRQASPTDTYSYGIAYRRSDERKGDEWDSFSLLRLPLAYEFDETRGSLSPRSGRRYRVGLEPVWSLSGSSDPFFIADLGWSSFRPLGDDLVLANQLGWTSLWPLTESADLDRVPPSDLLRAGGGGSVRGYPYRSIGVDGTEDGGTQRWGGSLELRSRFGENWGAALFTDVVSVSDEWNPTQNQDWFTGVGLGVRYYTAFAPIRFDVAFPLNNRDGDPNFQIYLSLGQSF